MPPFPGQVSKGRIPCCRHGDMEAVEDFIAVGKDVNQVACSADSVVALRMQCIPLDVPAQKCMAAAERRGKQDGAALCGRLQAQGHL